MKILFLDWGAFGKEPCIKALEEMGHEIIRFIHDDYHERISEDFDKAFDECVKTNGVRACFSFNFYPVMAEGAHRNSIKYISYVYDSPLVNVFSYKILYPENYCFLFDYALYERLRKGGIKTVYYMPLCAEVFDGCGTASSHFKEYKSDISFVGSLYNEDHNFYERMEKKLDSYTKGYLEGIMESQLKVYGFPFIEDMLDEDIMKAMYEALPYDPPFDGAQSREYIYANYFLARKMTQTERIRTLSAVADRHELYLYTVDKNAGIKGAVNKGSVDYYDQMPYVFANSRINLNITLRSIYSGIPLRAFDIMGCGGFLMTNYQEDFLRHFTPGEEFVYYESTDDLLSKIDYYLSHESERRDIALAGHEAIRKQHTFAIRMKEIFDVVFCE